jgi:hypothetical protein
VQTIGANNDIEFFATSVAKLNVHSLALLDLGNDGRKSEIGNGFRRFVQHLLQIISHQLHHIDATHQTISCQPHHHAPAAVVVTRGQNSGFERTQLVEQAKFPRVLVRYVG